MECRREQSWDQYCSYYTLTGRKKSHPFESYILFADDTVLYVADPSFSTIESKLNADLKNLYKYFTENELIINLKKNKTESMLFGTAKRLSSCPDELDLRYHDTKINSTTTYTYLGTTLDKTLTLNIYMGENFRVTQKNYRQSYVYSLL